jgi:hypothetical protein
VPGSLDQLLQPSVPDRAAPATRPWRLGSQVYVAFFGGAVSVAIIALLNATRLGMPARQRAIIAAIGVAGVVATVLAMSAVGFDRGGGASTLGIAGRAVALVAWGGMYLVQRSADRVYGYRATTAEPYASLIVPGLLVGIAGSAVQILLTVSLIGSGSVAA